MRYGAPQPVSDGRWSVDLLPELFRLGTSHRSACWHWHGSKDLLTATLFVTHKQAAHASSSEPFRIIGSPARFSDRGHWCRSRRRLGAHAPLRTDARREWDGLRGLLADAVRSGSRSRSVARTGHLDLDHAGDRAGAN